MDFRLTLSARRLLLVFILLAKFVTTAGIATAAPYSAGLSEAGGLSEAEKLAYMLPDGTIPIICLTVTGEGEGASHAICDGCCSSCKGLHRSLGALGIVDYLAKLGSLTNDAVTAQVNDSASYARGPPVS